MTCCTTDCCGPGSYCCANANPHTHTDDGDVVFVIEEDYDGCPMCNDGYHQNADEKGRCTCCGYDLSTSRPVRFTP